MLARYPCDRCGRRELACKLLDMQVSKRTHSSPAEHESWCRLCVGTPDHREKGDDDGREYGSPREALEDRR